MVPIITGLIVTVVGSIIFARYFEKPKPPAPSVQIQTSGDNSPVVQGNQGSVSIDNSASEQSKKHSQTAKPNTAEGRK